MEVLHALSVLLANGLLVMGTFVLREGAPIIGFGLAIMFARRQIREHADMNRGIEYDEVMA